MVKHFASFCVLDTHIPGCPISSVSEDLEYVYDIKDRFVLDAQEVVELSMDISVGLDPQGQEVTYLMLYSPLVSPESSKASFIMVSAIDVSGYVDYAAKLDFEPHQGNNHGTFRQRARARSRSTHWPLDQANTTTLPDYLQSVQTRRSCPAKICDHSLGSADPPSPRLEVEDVWMTIAREERSKTNWEPPRCRSNNAYDSASRTIQNQKQAKYLSRTISFADEEILSSFVGRLQVLYSQYFILSVNQETVKFYDITFLSPAVYHSGEWIAGHLSRNSIETMLGFRWQLARRRRFKGTLRWGDEGVKKQVFCIPLIGSEPDNWLCMLVDTDIPICW